MAVKSKKVKAKKTKVAKSKSKIKPVKSKLKKKVIKKSKPKINAKAKSVKKVLAKARSQVKTKTKAIAKTPEKNLSRPISGKSSGRTSIRLPARPTSELSYRPMQTLVRRSTMPSLVERRPVGPRSPRVHQFAYMKAPGMEHEFEVGDTVEVFCDHEKNRERIRGWVRGIVVQVDNKMVAVQFRSNVFLTDGWMVPDRILWYPVNSEHIRPVPGKKPVKKDFIPDY